MSSHPATLPSIGLLLGPIWEMSAETGHGAHWLCGRPGHAAPDQANDQDGDTKQHPEKARYDEEHHSPMHLFGRILAEAARRGLSEPAPALPGIIGEKQKGTDYKGSNEGAEQR